jgi:hypothetical protein
VFQVDHVFQLHNVVTLCIRERIPSMKKTPMMAMLPSTIRAAPKQFKNSRYASPLRFRVHMVYRFITGSGKFLAFE